MKRNKPPEQPTRIMPKRGKNVRNNGDEELGESSKTVQSSLDNPPRTRAKRKKTETTDTTSPSVVSTPNLTPGATANAGLPASRDSPDAHCSICLGDVEDRSFTDACYHTFCFECLVEWSRVRAVCPLCKKSFKSIVHKIESHSKYETYYVASNRTGSYIIDDDVGVGDHYGPAGGFFLPQPMHLPFIGSVGFWVSPENRASRSRHAAQLMEFRRRIYTNPEQIQLRGLWSATGAVIPPHNVSPMMFDCYPVMLERVRPWVHRDLRIIVGDTNITAVETLVLQLLRRFLITSEDFYSALFPHLGLHTRRFLQELDTFARSPFDMATFDERVIYTMSSESNRRSDGSHPTSSRIENISSSDDDSDVEIVSPDVAERSSMVSTNAPVRPTPMPFGMAAAEYYHNLSTIVAGHQRAAGNVVRGWDSPVPGPSSMRFWMPRDDNSNSSISPSSSAPEGVGFASDPTSLSGSAASDNAATIVSDSESDVLVVDDEILTCHSPITLLSSSEDEVLPICEQRKNRRSRKRNHPHRVAVNLSSSGATSHSGDDVTVKSDKPTAGGHFYESADASSDTAIRAEFLSVDTAQERQDAHHVKSKRRTVSDLEDDSYNISRSIPQRISSGGHNSNRSSPAVCQRQAGSRSSSVEIIGEISTDVFPPKLPKWPQAELAASSSSMSLGTGERRPLRPKRHRTKDPDVLTDKTTNVKSSSENDIGRPPCKKHISGHKSSKRKLAGEVTMDLPVSPKCGTSDNVAAEIDELQKGSSSVDNNAGASDCVDVGVDAGNFNSEVPEVGNVVVSVPIKNSPSVDVSTNGHSSSSQSSQVNTIADGSSMSNVGLSSNDALTAIAVADAERGDDPCNDADDKNQTILTDSSTCVDNVRSDSKLETMELTHTDCEPSGSSAGNVVDCSSECGRTVPDIVVVANCHATSDNAGDSGASATCIKTDSDNITTALNNSKNPVVSEDQCPTIVTSSNLEVVPVAFLPSVASLAEHKISCSAVDTNPDNDSTAPNKVSELPRISTTTIDDLDNVADDIRIPSVSLHSGRLSPTDCEPSSSAEIVFSVLSDDEDDDRMYTDVERSSSDTLSEFASEDETDNSEIEWLDSDLIAPRRRHISISSASSGHSSVIVSPSESRLLSSEPVDLTDTDDTESVVDDDDDDDFSVEMLSDDGEFVMLDQDERNAEKSMDNDEQHCLKFNLPESSEVLAMADTTRLTYRPVSVAAVPSDVDELSSDNGTRRAAHDRLIQTSEARLCSLDSAERHRLKLKQPEHEDDDQNLIDVSHLNFQSVNVNVTAHLFDFDKTTSDNKTLPAEYESKQQIPITQVTETCLGRAGLSCSESSDVHVMETDEQDVQAWTHPALLSEELVGSCSVPDSSTVSNSAVCDDQLEQVDISTCCSSFPLNLETQNSDCAMSKPRGQEDGLEAADSGRLPESGVLKGPTSWSALCDISVVNDLSPDSREPPLAVERIIATDAEIPSVCADGTSSSGNSCCQLECREVRTAGDDDTCITDVTELPDAETGRQNLATALPNDFSASDASSTCEVQRSSTDGTVSKTENVHVDSFCSDSETSRLDISLD